MMNIPPREIVEGLKNLFKPGTRVRLVKMLDIQAPPKGTLGTVNYVDDIGTIHISWDNGSGLGAVFDEDIVETVKD